MEQLTDSEMINYSLQMTKEDYSIRKLQEKWKEESEFDESNQKKNKLDLDKSHQLSPKEIMRRYREMNGGQM